MYIYICEIVDTLTIYIYLIFIVIYPKLTIFKMKVSKGAQIRNQYNQVPHLAQDATWEKYN